MTRKKYQRYSKEVKMEAVCLWKWGYNIHYIKEKLRLSTHTLVVNWIKEFEKDKQHAFSDKRKKNGGRPRKRFCSLEEELAYTKLQLDYAKKL